MVGPIHNFAQFAGRHTMTKNSAASRWALVGATTNLFIAAAGAGLLSYPYAVLQQGIALNLLLTILFAVVNFYTDLVLAASAFRVRRMLVALTYEELCLRLLGPYGYIGAVSTVIVGCFGVLVGFFVITADLAEPVVRQACAATGGPACEVVSNRAFILLVFAVAVAFPLSSCEKIHSLWGSSVIAALTVIAVGVLVVSKGAEAILGGPSLALCVGSLGSQSPYVKNTVAWFNLSLNALLGVPLMVFALGE
jgi:amino acid permease